MGCCGSSLVLVVLLMVAFELIVIKRMVDFYEVIRPFLLAEDMRGRDRKREIKRV